MIKLVNNNFKSDEELQMFMCFDDDEHEMLEKIEKTMNDSFKFEKVY